MDVDSPAASFQESEEKKLQRSLTPTSVSIQKTFHRRPLFAAAILIFLALLLNWPLVTGDFYADDFFFLNELRNPESDFSRWLGIWSVEGYEGFEHIWWKDHDWKARFWRPLPSLAIEGSLSLFGHNPMPLHVLAILLHAAIGGGLFWLVRKLSDSTGLGFLAGLFYITCEDHSLVVGWIATITDPMAVVFILTALLAFAHWLQTRKTWALCGALGALVLSLACKETSVVTPIIMILLAVFMPNGRENNESARSGWRERWRRVFRDYATWVPPLAVLAAYLVLYKLWPLGYMNNLLYIDPLSHPATYIGHAMIHVPILWLSTLSSFPPILTVFVPALQVGAAAFGVVFFVIWFTGWWPLRKNRLAAWAMIGYLLALLPQAAVDAAERSVYFPMVPAAIVLAILVGTISRVAGQIDRGPLIAPRWTRIVGWLSVLIVLIPSTLISAVRPYLLVPAMAKPESEVMTAAPWIERRGPEHTMLLNASNCVISVYAWDYIAYRSGAPKDVWTLSAASGIFTLERTGDSSFVIRTDRPGWLSNFFARVVRVHEPLELNGRYVKGPFTATLLELTEDHSDVLAVRFDLNRPLSDPAWLFLRWNGNRFEPLDVAALPLGQRVELADTGDVLRSLW